MNKLFDEIYRLILSDDPSEKCQSTQALAAEFDCFSLEHDHSKHEILEPGYPPKLKLVAPRELKRRGIQHQEGRNILLHAIAHIEFNAINLALDAAYRFRDQPLEFYRDWVNIAADEARHFELIRGYLNNNDCEYGDYQAHNGLWQMAVDTQHNVVARMALVPRVLEARGLDVTPGIIEKLKRANDQDAVNILTTIYNDEIGHVKIGSHWFFYQCEKRKLEPRNTFTKMVETYLHGELKGPFNIAARLQAGFDEIEMDALNSRYG